MDANLKVWYEDITQNMQTLNDVTSTLEYDVNELKEHADKDWDINDETHGGFIKNRPIYRRTGYNLIGHEAKSGSAFSGKEGEYLTYQGIYFGQVIIGAKYRFTVDNKYVFDAVGVNEKRIEYVSGDFIGIIYDTGLTIPYYIYEETGKDTGHDFKLEVYVENEIIIEDSYIPRLQSDYSIEDKTESRYIANKVVIEGNYYETLMKDATFEYNYTTAGCAQGFINGYCLMNKKAPHLGYPNDALMIVNNGVQEYIVPIKENTDFTYEGDKDKKFLIFANDWVESNCTSPMSIWMPEEIYNQKNGDIKISFLLKIQEEKILVNHDGAPLLKPLILDSTIDYSLLPFKSDEALQAIIDGRQILIRVPNADGNNYTANYMPVIQYQLPNVNNNYLYLIYLKDGLANNIASVIGALMQGQQASFDNVYGQLKMELSKTYTECPMK